MFQDCEFLEGRIRKNKALPMTGIGLSMLSPYLKGYGC